MWAQYAQVLHMEELRKVLNMKVYVDTDDDVRLARRIQKDVTLRGRDVQGKCCAWYGLACCA